MYVVTSVHVQERVPIISVVKGRRSGWATAADLPNLPMLSDLASNDHDRKVLEFLSLAPAMGRPFFMPPNTPVERVAAIRNAFMLTMKDPQFVQDAERSKLDLSPTSGEELEQITIQTLSAPNEVLELAKKAMD